MHINENSTWRLVKFFRYNRFALGNLGIGRPRRPKYLNTSLYAYPINGANLTHVSSQFDARVFSFSFLVRVFSFGVKCERFCFLFIYDFHCCKCTFLLHYHMVSELLLLIISRVGWGNSGQGLFWTWWGNFGQTEI